MNDLYTNEFYGKHRIPKGLVWNRQTEALEWIDPSFNFEYQLGWERRFSQMWSELTASQKIQIDPIQPPYTEEDVVLFLDTLKRIMRAQSVFGSVQSWFSNKEPSQEFPVFALEIEPIFTTKALPWMIEIQSGSFDMGKGEAVHEVEITKPFFIGKHPVTQRLWESVMGNNPSQFKGAYRPVESVSWFDCVRFCNKVSDLEGLDHAYTILGNEVVWNEDSDGYRLPTEAEWEYAARAGTDFKYAGSNSLHEVGWYDGNSGRRTHPVGEKKSNDWGLYDMSGNVFEWCWDWKGDCPSSKQTDPKGPNSGSIRVRRGGSWRDDAGSARVANRNDRVPSFRFNRLGFRFSRSSR